MTSKWTSYDAQLVEGTAQLVDMVHLPNLKGYLPQWNTEGPKIEHATWPEATRIADVPN